MLYRISDREVGLIRVSENKTTLDQLLRRPKDRLRYEYDFGDGWEHNVILEALLPPGNDGRYPIVEAGRRACPPEDVGGIHGYAHFLEVLANPKHPEHREMLEWVGKPVDPASFDVTQANLDIHGGWVRFDPDAYNRLKQSAGDYFPEALGINKGFPFLSLKAPMACCPSLEIIHRRSAATFHPLPHFQIPGFSLRSAIRLKPSTAP